MIRYSRGALIARQVPPSVSAVRCLLNSFSVYNKLVTTTLRYTPVVLEHHAPYRTLGNGKLCVYYAIFLEDLFLIPARQQTACSNTKIQNITETYPIIFPQHPTYSFTAHG
jgi:hypothetical protein